METSKLWKFNVVLSAILGFGFIAGSSPLSADDYGPWAIGFDLSFPKETGSTSDALRQGFGFDFHTQYQKPETPFGLRLDVIQASFDLSDDVIRHIDGADSGWASFWGVGTNVAVSPIHSKRFKPSLYAGPGFYYEHAEATRSGVTTGVICDPWFGCYNALVPGQTGVADMSTSRLGWQGGAGLDFIFNGGGAISFNVQYVRINNTNNDTEFIPINVGFTQHF